EDSFASSILDLSGVARTAFSWQDHLGLAGAVARTLAVQFQLDSAPRVELPDLPRETALLETEVLEIKAAAQDDYGVNRLGLVWETSTALESTNQTAGKDF